MEKVKIEMKIKAMVADGWVNCPISKNVYRKIIGTDDKGLPIIKEITIEDLRKHKGDLQKCLECKYG